MTIVDSKSKIGTLRSRITWSRCVLAALWIVLAAASLYAFADEPAPADANDPRAAAPSPPTAPDSDEEELEPLSAETLQIVGALESSLPETSEARLMLKAIVDGSELGPEEGWFSVAHPQTRFPWEAVRQRYDANADGAIAEEEFPGAEGDFARLDHDRDGELTEADFTTQEAGIRSPGAMLLYFGDSDSNGKLTRDEFAGLFDTWDKEGAGFLSLGDLAERMTSPRPQPGASSEGPTRDILIRGLQLQEIGSHQAGPALDEPAPDFTLKSFDGKESITLSQKIGQKPVVLVFGNFTCGPFRNQAGNIEKLYRRYGDRAEFVLVYVREAHPRDGWKMTSNERRGVDVVQPATYDERVAVANVCRERLAFDLPFVVDEIDDTVGARYSGMPSRLYLIDREGRIAFKSGRGPYYFRPAELEQALVLLLAETEKPPAENHAAPSECR